MNRYPLILISFLIYIVPFCGFSDEVNQNESVSFDLTSLVIRALEQDPRISNAAIGVKVGEAREQQAFGALLPQASISALWSDNKRQVQGDPTTEYPGEKFTLSIRQTLFDKVKYHGWKSAEAEIEKYLSQEKNLRAEVLLEVVTKYFEYLSVLDQLNLTRDEKKSTEKRLNQIERLYERQRVKITDLLQTQARLDRVKSEEIALSNDLDNARTALAEVVGIYPRDIANLNEAMRPVAEDENLEYWLNLAQQNNARLMELKHMLSAAREQVKLENAGHYPKLELSYTKQESNLVDDNIQSRDTSTDSIGVLLNVPLYSGGQTSARVAEKREILKSAENDYERQSRMVTTYVREYYNNINTAIRRYDAMKKAVDSANKSYEAMSKGFKLGATTIVDVLDAEEELNKVLQQFQQLKYEYIVSRTNLYYQAGLLDMQFVDETNNLLSSQ